MSTSSMACNWLIRKSLLLTSGLGRQDHVLLPPDFALGTLGLLVPDEPVLMAVPGGDHVVKSVAIDVVGEHLGGGRSNWNACSVQV